MSQVYDGRLNLVCYQISAELALAMGKQLYDDGEKLLESKKKEV